MKTITLTTDFGLNNWFVGTMKGVIEKIAPGHRVIDLNHGVAHFDVAEAAFSLSSSYHYFPRETIHVVVVDPGVGSARRPLVACNEKYCFVAPDNGVLSLIADREPDLMYYHATQEHYYLPHISDTFHGRDIFAPLAAHLANGVDPSELGPRIDDPAALETPRMEKTNRGTICGYVLYIDPFGNIITNIATAELTASIEVEVTPLLPRISGIHASYDSVKIGEPVALRGSSGFLEIAVNQGHASNEFNIRKGDEIFVYLNIEKESKPYEFAH